MIIKIKTTFTTQEAWAYVKKQLAPVFVAGAGVLVTAWAVAGIVALAAWTTYSRDSDPGWIIIWLLVTGAWGGYFAYLDSSK